MRLPVRSLIDAWRRTWFGPQPPFRACVMSHTSPERILVVRGRTTYAHCHQRLRRWCISRSPNYPAAVGAPPPFWRPRCPSTQIPDLRCAVLLCHAVTVMARIRPRPPLKAAPAADAPATDGVDAAVAAETEGEEGRQEEAGLEALRRRLADVGLVSAGRHRHDLRAPARRNRGGPPPRRRGRQAVEERRLRGREELGRNNGSLGAVLAARRPPTPAMPSPTKAPVRSPPANCAATSRTTTGWPSSPPCRRSSVCSVPSSV